MMVDSFVIGIDLGTTNSLVAVMEKGKPTIIPNLLGNYITPSVVRILENGNYIVGENAAKALITDPKNTIAGIKRFIGRRYNEVMDILPTVPFDVVLGRNNFAMVRCHGVDYSPLVISAMILQYLKASAEAYLGGEVSQAVITVPAYFSDSQRHATKDAGKIAGLEVIRIVNEPTAASMAYGLDTKHDEIIIVFDLGGGTFDIDILEIGDGVFEVLVHKGDGFLGGDDFDNIIIDWILEEIKLEYGVNLSHNVLALQRIREVAKQAKCELSDVSQTQINIPYPIKKDEEFINLELILTRTKFEEICEELFERLIPPLEQALVDARLSLSHIDKSDIDKVVLVGGATRMKKVSEIIQRVFKTQPSSSVNPDEAVALGAGIQAGVLDGLDGKIKDILLLDATPHSLGIETEGGVFTKIIQRNTTIPTKKSEVFSTLLDGQTSVEIHVMEGEREFAIDNRTLCRFILDRIPAAPRGVPQIEVTFDIDENSMLDVTAKDKGTGREQTVSIILSSISNNEIEVFSNILDKNTASIQKMQLD